MKKKILILSLIFLLSICFTDTLASDFYAICENIETGATAKFSCLSGGTPLSNELIYYDTQVVYVEGEFADKEKNGWDGIIFSTDDIPTEPVIEIIAELSEHNIVDDPAIEIRVDPTNTNVYNKKLGELKIDLKSYVYLDVSNYVNYGGKNFLIMPSPSGAGLKVNRVRIINKDQVSDITIIDSQKQDLGLIIGIVFLILIVLLVSLTRFKELEKSSIYQNISKSSLE